MEDFETSSSYVFYYGDLNYSDFNNPFEIANVGRKHNRKGLQLFLRFLKNNNCYTSFVFIVGRNALNRMKLHVLQSRDIYIVLRYIITSYCYDDLLVALHENVDYWREINLKWQEEFDKWFEPLYTFNAQDNFKKYIKYTDSFEDL